MTRPLCGRYMCDHSPTERGQTMEGMLADMQNDWETVAASNKQDMLAKRESEALGTFSDFGLSFDSVAGRFMERLEQHHQPTHLHSIRVAADAYHLAVKAGAPAGLTSADAYKMGLLHDIGKLEIDPAILDKGFNGVPLTSADWKQIRQHTKTGYEMLKDELPLAAYAAGKHHPAYAVRARSPAKGADRLVKLVTMTDFYDALLTRQNGQYKKIDINSRDAVLAALTKGFPGQKKEAALLVSNTNEGNT